VSNHIVSFNHPQARQIVESVPIGDKRADRRSEACSLRDHRGVSDDDVEFRRRRGSRASFQRRTLTTNTSSPLHVTCGPIASPERDLVAEGGSLEKLLKASNDRNLHLSTFLRRPSLTPTETGSTRPGPVAASRQRRAPARSWARVIRIGSRTSSCRFERLVDSPRVE